MSNDPLWPIGRKYQRIYLKASISLWLQTGDGRGAEKEAADFLLAIKATSQKDGGKAGCFVPALNVKEKIKSFQNEEVYP